MEGLVSGFLSDMNIANMIADYVDDRFNVELQQKNVALNAFGVNDARTHQVLNMLVRDLPKFIAPVSNEQFLHPVEHLFTDQPVTTLYTRTSHITISSLVRWLQARKLTLSKDQVLAFLGYFLGVIFELEQRLLVDFPIRQDTFLIYEARLNMGNPVFINSFVQNLVQVFCYS